MPLAGKVRLNTVLGVAGGILVGGALVGIVGFGLVTVVGGAGAGAFLMFTPAEAPPPSFSGPSELVAVSSEPVPAPIDPAAVPLPPGTGQDEIMRAYFGKDLGTDKLKDAPVGQPWKVNVYQDAGKTTANRLKIDVDRDEKDDEKWDLAEVPPLRQVSTQDDGVYDQRYRWLNEAWQLEGAASPAPSAGTPAAVGRPVDQDLLAWKGKALGSDKIKDATSGKPYKINLYQDAGSPFANRAKIDLDRDDKWDEKITFDGDTVKREVAPNDDENYTVKTVWSGTEWVPEK